MKKQRTLLFVCMLLLIGMPALQSCMNDSWEDEYNMIAIGTVRVIEGNDYYFSLDEGSKLYPKDTSAILNYTVTDGQRAFIYFSEMDEQTEGYKYTARIRHIENILTKDAFVMTEAQADSIGDDRINVTDLWITDNYLNIKYQIFYTNDPEKKHMLNLVLNESSTGENDRDGYLTLELRHNAYDDPGTEVGTGVVSFKLDKLNELLADKQGVNLRFRSLYESVKYSTIDFKQE